MSSGISFINNFPYYPDQDFLLSQTDPCRALSKWKDKDIVIRNKSQPKMDLLPNGA
jgi:hypothetical protein